MTILRLFICVLLMSVGASCRCGTGIQGTESELVVSPTALDLGDVYVAQTVTGVVDIANNGGASASLTASIDAPFSVEPATRAMAASAEPHAFAVAVKRSRAPSPACR